MVKDYYKILGLSKDASDDSIKQAYRKLALRYHPDKNKDHDAEERFKEVVEAYNLLTITKKRDVTSSTSSTSDTADGNNKDGTADERDKSSTTGTRCESGTKSNNSSSATAGASGMSGSTGPGGESGTKSNNTSSAGASGMSGTKDNDSSSGKGKPFQTTCESPSYSGYTKATSGVNSTSGTDTSKSGTTTSAPQFFPWEKPFQTSSNLNSNTVGASGTDDIKSNCDTSTGTGSTGTTRGTGGTSSNCGPTTPTAQFFTPGKPYQPFRNPNCSNAGTSTCTSSTSKPKSSNSFVPGKPFQTFSNLNSSTSSTNGIGSKSAPSFHIGASGASNKTYEGESKTFAQFFKSNSDMFGASTSSAGMKSSDSMNREAKTTSEQFFGLGKPFQTSCNLNSSTSGSKTTPEQFFGTGKPFETFSNRNSEAGGTRVGCTCGSTPTSTNREEKTQDPPIVHDLFVTLEDIASGCVKEMKICRRVLQPDGTFKKEDKVLSVNVKPGWKAGTKITFHKEGDQGPNNIPADIVYVIRDVPHLIFTRDGSDIKYLAKLNLKQALCGTTIKVPTINYSLKVVDLQDEIVTPHTVKRFPGYGLPLPDEPTRKGDLVVMFDIIFPKYLSLEEKEQLSGTLKDFSFGVAPAAVTRAHPRPRRGAIRRPVYRN